MTMERPPEIVRSKDELIPERPYDGSSRSSTAMGSCDLASRTICAPLDSSLSTRISLQFNLLPQGSQSNEALP